MFRRLLAWVRNALSKALQRLQEPRKALPPARTTPTPIDASLGVFCASCKAPHDYDEGPDEGFCLKCGGPLQDVGDWLTPEEAARRRAGLLQKVLVDNLDFLHRRDPNPKVIN